MRSVETRLEKLEASQLPSEPFRSVVSFVDPADGEAWSAMAIEAGRGQVTFERVATEPEAEFNKRVLVAMGWQ
jgi:hypothetical protein